ncbi:Protein kinase superfamily protein [Forsythia ovata]|uniref:Protein kinase superfamily protein n=1 Tax=Forsythia ovata TaxID=205694 RepID=A0ABD1S094_9LAMI
MGFLPGMAAILASQSCYCHNGELVNHGRTGDNLSFSGSVSSHNYLKFQKEACRMLKTTKIYRFQVEMQQTELPAKIGSNGWVIKMVPTSEVRKRMLMSKIFSKPVNMNKEKVNGVSLVKRDPVFSLSKELPPTEGVKVDEGFSWANENYNFIQRTMDVWSFVISLHLRVLLDNAKWTYIGGFTEEKKADRRQKTASWLRECILQLGPTFIKLGQLLSSRSDLFPREIVDELTKLQDRVPAFSPSKAKNLIERELGTPIKLLFKEFEDLPIAAASLGQNNALKDEVYKLKDQVAPVATVAKLANEKIRRKETEFEDLVHRYGEMNEKLLEVMSKKMDVKGRWDILDESLNNKFVSWWWAWRPARQTIRS